MSKDKPKVKPLISNGIFYTLLVVAVIGYFSYPFFVEEERNQYPDQRKSVENTRTCENWMNRYPVVTYNQFPSGTLNVEKGETWVIQLDPQTWSGTVNFNYRYFNIQPENSVQVRLPNGLVIEDNPQKDIHLQNKNGFKFKGKTCVLVSN